MMAVILDISMSLDGYVTARGVRPEEPMGDGGQQLHEWAFGADERGSEVLAEGQRSAGASIAGRDGVTREEPRPADRNPLLTERDERR